MKQKLRMILGFVLIGVAVFAGVRFFLDVYSPTNVKTEQLGPAVTATAPTAPAVNNNDTSSYDLAPVEAEDIPTVDFASLQAINPDIYAWIEIPGTDISYPVVQHPTNDRYYLRTNSDGNYSAGGAIFSEATYNSKDFNDPVTILYGHHMNAGDIMFGHLQEFYSDPDFLAEDNHIRIYTADGMQEYAVFAAVPYDRSHILYYNDMSDSVIYQTFMQSILSIRELGSYINEAHAPQDPAEDKVLILSTCLIGNNTRRFLVLATRVD
ncbi:MAG: class B sortase [Clostridiales bacterium]|nr:class B sortase [Clostridiales bacterium]